nr:PREDICTED: zinc finger C2HC domain-containing protein 1A [Paralichthys olivaceus]
MMEEQEDVEVPQDLAECNTCKRSFNPKVLEKHAKICQKSAAKRRKVFDSSRQRAEGTDIPVLKPIKPKSQSTSATGKAEPPKKPSNWRRKHEDFIATIRAAKTLTQVMKDGGPLPPPPPPTYDPDSNPAAWFLFVRKDVDDGNEVDNSGLKSKFCHACGTKYPVESAKFCCECGIRRMCI